MESVERGLDSSKHAKHSTRKPKSVTKQPRKGHKGEELSTGTKSRKRKKSATHKVSERVPSARSRSAIDEAPLLTTEISATEQPALSKEAQRRDESVHPGNEDEVSVRVRQSDRNGVGGAQRDTRGSRAGSREALRSQSAAANLGDSAPPGGMALAIGPEEHRTAQVAPPHGRTGQPPPVSGNVGLCKSAATNVGSPAEAGPALDSAGRALPPLVTGGDPVSAPESVGLSVLGSEVASKSGAFLAESRLSVATEASTFGASAQRSRMSVPGAHRRSLQLQRVNEAIAERAAMDRRKSILLQERVTWWSTLTKSCVAVAAFAWVGGALLLLLAVYAGRKSHAHKSCTTPGCIEFARSLRQSINISVQPCENFGRFVCDGWRTRYRLTVHEQAFVKVLESVGLSLLTVPVSGNQGQHSAKQKAALLYRSCDSVRRGDRDELENVREALRSEGIVWPHRSSDPDFLHVALRSSLVLRWGVPFDVTLRSEGKHLVVQLEAFEMFALLRDKFVATSPGSPERKAYFDTLQSNFKMNDSHLLHLDEVNDLDKAAFAMLPKSVQASHYAVRLDEKHVFAGVDNVTQEYWRQELSPFVSLNKTERIVFATHTENFIRKVWELWAVKGGEDMHIFVSWCVVQIAALFANEQLQVNFYGSTEAAHFEQGASCLAKAFLIAGTDVFSGYNNFVFAGRARLRAHKLVRALRRAFLHRLQQWKYYDADVTVTLERDTTEVPVHVVHTGSVVEVNDLVPAMHDSLVHNWQNTPVTSPANVSLRSSIYSVIEAAQLLVFQDKDFLMMPYAFAFPYFDRSSTAGFNYAGAGGIAAFALAKLFLAAYGASKRANASLETSLRCLKNASANAVARDNSQLVMARALAASVAFQAYESESASWDITVQNLEEYSGAQLFFMASCYVLCPGSARGHEDGAQCNAHLQNLEEFARAFACALGTKMNPQSKCSIM
ncbi:uncharacterized protein LOC142579952 [Dermacentor variabilis]|uniref:uncharacterized protein LOC142579952 n=1 Tax=Dermacentor variabilis TaxID=34621 RepID=UPI003F5C20F6